MALCIILHSPLMYIYSCYSYMQRCGNSDPMNYGTFWPGLFSSLLFCAPYTCVLFSFYLPDIYKIYQRISCIYHWLYVSTTVGTSKPKKYANNFGRLTYDPKLNKPLPYNPTQVQFFLYFEV